MKIGFFGDSFCATLESHHGYKTYISMIQQHYNAEIINLGYGGSSIYDLLKLQLPPFLYDNYLDVYVFVWTDPGRLFHRTVRNLNFASIEERLHDPIYNPIISAARNFYKYLYDIEIQYLQYIAILKYADSDILPNILSTSKIIHLWSFGELPSGGWNGQDFDVSEINYSHTWKTGVEVRPSLVTLSLSAHKNYMNKMSTLNMNKMSTLRKTNHIVGHDLNQQLANTIIDTIDNYNNYYQQIKRIL
jgi:hypothetical protein